LKQPKWCYTQDTHDDIRFIDDDNALSSQPTQKIMSWGIRNHQLGMKHRHQATKIVISTIEVTAMALWPHVFQDSTIRNKAFQNQSDWAWENFRDTSSKNSVTH